MRLPRWTVAALGILTAAGVPPPAAAADDQIRVLILMPRESRQMLAKQLGRETMPSRLGSIVGS